MKNAALDMSVSRDDNVTTEISGAARESDVATAADMSAPCVNGISVLRDGDVTTEVSNSSRRSAVSTSALYMPVSRDDHVTTDIAAAARERDSARAGDIHRSDLNAIEVLRTRRLS